MSSATLSEVGMTTGVKKVLRAVATHAAEPMARAGPVLPEESTTAFRKKRRTRSKDGGHAVGRQSSPGIASYFKKQQKEEEEA